MKKFKINTNWFYFKFGWHFNISYELCGYFDPRHRINLDLIFWRMEIVLPFKSKYTDECDPPQWGIAYHNQTFWIYRGGKGNMNGGNKWLTINMPWQWDWVRTSSLRKDGTWEHELKGQRKDFWKDEWKEVLWSETYPYSYVLKSGKVQNANATVKVEEIEWRLRGFKKVKFIKRISTDIKVDFDIEIGEESGSWKGGVLRCGYKMKHGELPIHTLRRMEKEIKFN